MKHYYILDNTQIKGFIEVSEEELHSLVGTDEICTYVYKVYSGILLVEEVPEELRDQVKTVVNNKIAKWGEYKNQEINSNELQSLLEEVL